MATTPHYDVFRYLNKALATIRDNPSYAVIPAFCIAGVIYHLMNSRPEEIQCYDLGRDSNETEQLETAAMAMPNAWVRYRPHPKASQLPETLPLIVFLEDPSHLSDEHSDVADHHFDHLGPRIWGSAPCLFVGVHHFNAFADVDSLRSIILSLIRQYAKHPQVVLVSYDWGCELAEGIVDERIKGLIYICPKAPSMEYGDLSKPRLIIAEDDLQDPVGSFRVNDKPCFRTPLLRSVPSHTLLHVPRAYKIVSALIHRFLADEIDPHFSRGWQMQKTSKPQESKWNAKSLQKWRETQAVSQPIGCFRAMKTMRDDDDHCPETLANHWNDIIAVLDISSTDPLYTPGDLQMKRDIVYSKFPSESKYVPTQKEVQTFIEKVNVIRAKNSEDSATIAVHCHYGFNRTGFFIISYLVEQEAWKVEDAIHEFSKRRAPGLKHTWFEDELHLRYCETWQGLG